MCASVSNNDMELKTLDTENVKLQAAVDTYNTDSMRAEKFVELVRRHTEFSASLLNEFVEKQSFTKRSKVGENGQCKWIFT